MPLLIKFDGDVTNADIPRAQVQRKLRQPASQHPIHAPHFYSHVP